MTSISPEAAARPGLDDLLGPAAIADPTGYFGRLRDVDPVYWNERWHGWIVTDYATVVGGFRNHRQLSSDRFRGPFARDMSESRSEYSELIAFMSKWMFSNDRPYHTHLRSLVNAAFTPRSVDRLRPRIRELILELVEPFRSGGPVNFMSTFAFPLPVMVIAEYLGLPTESRDTVRALSEDLGALIFVQGSTEDRFARGQRAMEGLVDIIRPVVRARAADPREDLISGMLHAEVDGDAFTEDEIVSNAVLMMFAGHETTMNLLASGVVAFDRNPDQWARLRADPQLARPAAEEVLRFDGPIKALARWAREPLKLGDHDIAEFDRILLVQHAANHDPKVFADPERFDVSRSPNKHVAFGSGIHTCLGAPLSRLEAQEAFLHLAQTFTSVEVTSPELHYVPTVVSRGLTALEARFTAA